MQDLMTEGFCYKNTNIITICSEKTCSRISVYFRRSTGFKEVWSLLETQTALHFIKKKGMRVRSCLSISHTVPV